MNKSRKSNGVFSRVQYEIRVFYGFIIYIFLFISILILMIGGIPSSPCGPIARLRGSGCVRAIYRDVDALNNTMDVFFTADGKSVIFADEQTIRIQKTSLFSRARSFPIEEIVLGKNVSGSNLQLLEFTVSLDGKTAAVCAEMDGGQTKDSNSIHLFDLDTGEVIQKITREDMHCGAKNDLRFTSNKQQIAFWWHNGFGIPEDSLAIIELSDGSIQTIPFGHGTPFSISPDGKSIAALAYNNSTISIWNSPFLQETRNLIIPTGVRKLIYSPDGKAIYAGGAKNIWKVTTDSGDQLLKIPVPDAHFSDMAVSTNETTIAISFLEDYPDTSTVIIYDLISGQMTKTISLKEDHFSLALSPEGNLLAIGTDNQVMIFNVSK